MAYARNSRIGFNREIAARFVAPSVWVTWVVLLSLLGLTVVIAILGWKSAAHTDVPASGYVALALGVIFSLVVGIGLMTLVFYSSRAGFDEPAKLIEPDKHEPE
jgi:hypothetical protein